MIPTGTHLEMQNWDRTGDRAGLSAGRSIPPALFLCPSLSVSLSLLMVFPFCLSPGLPLSLCVSISLCLSLLLLSLSSSQSSSFSFSFPVSFSISFLSPSLFPSLHPSALPQAFPLVPIVPRPVLGKFGTRQRSQVDSLPFEGSQSSWQKEERNAQNKWEESTRPLRREHSLLLPGLAPLSPASSCLPASRQFLLPRVMRSRVGTRTGM